MFVIVALVPCWSQPAATKDVSIEVHELVDGGSKYTHRIITVHGCFVKEFEIRVLQPCDARFDQFGKYSIWLDDIKQVTEQAEQTKATFIAAESAAVLKNGRGDLWKSDSNRDHPLAIIVRGEFQTSRSRRYGHLDAYRRRFIVHSFLERVGSEKLSVN
jgi:hypothetical protein